MCVWANVSITACVCSCACKYERKYVHVYEAACRGFDDVLDHSLIWMHARGRERCNSLIWMHAGSLLLDLDACTEPTLSFAWLTLLFARMPGTYSLCVSPKHTFPSILVILVPSVSLSMTVLWSYIQDFFQHSLSLKHYHIRFVKQLSNTSTRQTSFFFNAGLCCFVPFSAVAIGLQFLFLVVLSYGLV